MINKTLRFFQLSSDCWCAFIANCIKIQTNLLETKEDFSFYDCWYIIVIDIILFQNQSFQVFPRLIVAKRVAAFVSNASLPQINALEILPIRVFAKKNIFPHS